jgi:pimeloyl-ACP methyl ester carboxylesterase
MPELTPRVLNGLRLGVLDFAPGDRDLPVLVCLHGHFGRAALYRFLGEALRDAWRVVALEQRGHGLSDKPAGGAAGYTREAYVADAAALIESLGLPPGRRAVVLGSSLGGANAYQLAARRPDLVRAFVVEDMTAVPKDDLSFCLKWPRRFDTVRDAVRLFARDGGFPVTYFLESLVERPEGWQFLFEPEHIVASQLLLNGDHWADWLASTCPALLLRGGTSTVLPADEAAAMVARRPNTSFVEFPGVGHNINEADPDGFVRAVRTFLGGLSSE